MPWKECKPMDERLKFIARLLEGDLDSGQGRDDRLTVADDQRVPITARVYANGAFIEHEFRPIGLNDACPDDGCVLKPRTE